MKVWVVGGHVDVKGNGDGDGDSDGGKTFVYLFSIILTLKKNRKISINKKIEKSLFLSSSM